MAQLLASSASPDGTPPLTLAATLDVSLAMLADTSPYPGWTVASIALQASIQSRTQACRVSLALREATQLGTLIPAPTVLLGNQATTRLYPVLCAPLASTQRKQRRTARTALQEQPTSTQIQQLPALFAHPGLLKLSQPAPESRIWAAHLLPGFVRLAHLVGWIPTSMLQHRAMCAALARMPSATLQLALTALRAMPRCTARPLHATNAPPEQKRHFASSLQEVNSRTTMHAVLQTPTRQCAPLRGWQPVWEGIRSVTHVRLDSPTSTTAPRRRASFAPTRATGVSGASRLASGWATAARALPATCTIPEERRALQPTIRLVSLEPTHRAPLRCAPHAERAGQIATQTQRHRAMSAEQDTTQA